MKIRTVGMDLAKQVFQVHGVDAQGEAVLRKKLERSKVLEFFVFAAVPDWHGSVRQCALLCAQAPGNGACRQADSPTIRQTLRQDEQE